MPKDYRIHTDNFYILPCGRRFQSKIKDPKIVTLHKKTCPQCSIADTMIGKMKKNNMTCKEYNIRLT